VSWCSILLKPHLVEQVIIDIFQKVWQIILKKCKIVFRVQMLLKKVWTYVYVISKNTYPNINRPLSLKFLTSLPMRVLIGRITIIMSINAPSITERGFIRKEHLFSIKYKFL